MARFGGVLQIGLYAAVFAAIFAHVLLGDVADLPRINDSRALTDAMTPLQDVCVERFFDKWGHMVCFGRSVLLVQYDSATKIPAIRRRYQYERSISHPDYGVYLDVDSIVDSGEEEECPARRRAEVHIECCRPSEASAASHTSRIIRLPRSEETVLSSSMLGIRKTIEKNPCSMEIHVCSSLVCANQTTQPVHGDEPHEQQKSRSPAYISEIEQSELRIRVQDMFVHAYDSYIAHAFPHGELHPIECSGGPFEPIKLPAVTLIDTLDTLVIMVSKFP